MIKSNQVYLEHVQLASSDSHTHPALCPRGKPTVEGRANISGTTRTFGCKRTAR